MAAKKTDPPQPLLRCRDPDWNKKGRELSLPFFVCIFTPEIAARSDVRRIGDVVSVGVLHTKEPAPHVVEVLGNLFAGSVIDRNDIPLQILRKVVGLAARLQSDDAALRYRV